MTNIKKLMLGAAAALSLGIGVAMAEGESPGGADVINQPAFPGYYVQQSHTVILSSPQAGSSDVEWARTPTYPDAVLSGGGNG